MKPYIKLTGSCFNPDGWTEEQQSQFLDKICDIAESFGAEVQLSCLIERFTEKEIEDLD